MWSICDGRNNSLHIFYSEAASLYFEIVPHKCYARDFRSLENTYPILPPVHIASTIRIAAPKTDGLLRLALPCSPVKLPCLDRRIIRGKHLR